MQAQHMSNLLHEGAPCRLSLVGNLGQRPLELRIAETLGYELMDILDAILVLDGLVAFDRVEELLDLVYRSFLVGALGVIQHVVRQGVDHLVRDGRSILQMRRRDVDRIGCRVVESAVPFKARVIH